MIIGNFGLLIGVALVIIQINQNTELVREQLDHAIWTDDLNLQLALMGENPSAEFKPTALCAGAIICTRAATRAPLYCREVGECVGFGYCPTRKRTNALHNATSELCPLLPFFT
jgi:hypothetical protein